GKAVWLDVNQIIADTLTLVRSEVARNHVSLAIDLADELPPVQVDPVQIQQVILNLVVNAIEAVSAQPTPSRAVEISTSVVPAGQVIVTVSDSGGGLGSAEQDRLFDAFYTTKPDGMGMGLAISRSIVESHGGRIWAGAAGGRGAAFSFSLPAGKAAIHEPGIARKAPVRK
ncbi:MAG: GHKL domain-containing protein, partial [Mesorhizobium sp.]|nr:GHKL domain-containing protein [Mesorhizobium sp.]